MSISMVIANPCSVSIPCYDSSSRCQYSSYAFYLGGGTQSANMYLNINYYISIFLFYILRNELNQEVPFLGGCC